MDAKSKLAIGLVFAAVLWFGYGGVRDTDESRHADPDYTAVRTQHRVVVTTMNDSALILLGTLLAMSREQAPPHATAAQPRLAPEAVGNALPATPEALGTAYSRSALTTTDNKR
jgi:hypothetical protein